MKKKHTIPKQKKVNPLDSPQWVSESTFAASAQPAAGSGSPSVSGSGSGSNKPCNIEFIEKCVIVPWANSTFNAWPLLENNCDEVGWGIKEPAQGATISDGVVTFGEDGADIEIVATCRNAKASMRLVYVKAELFEVEFRNAHSKTTQSNIITDEAVSYIQGGNLFVPPFRGWLIEDEIVKCFPVAHSFEDIPDLRVCFTITPAGLACVISGSGIPGDFGAPIRWKSDQFLSEGEPQRIPVPTDAGRLQQSAGITYGFITWEVSAKCCPGATGTVGVDTMPVSTGEHEIFRTFARPNADGEDVVAPSMVRMRKVCSFAEGATTDPQAVRMLVEQWPFVPIDEHYDPDGHDWRIFQNESADCDDHCTCLSQGIKLLGLVAKYFKIYASEADDNCLEEDTKQVEVDGVQKTAVLWFGTATGGSPGENVASVGGNRHQGVVRAGGYWWNIYAIPIERLWAYSSCDLFNMLTAVVPGIPGTGVFEAQYWVTEKIVNDERSFIIYSTENIPTLNCDD